MKLLPDWITKGYLRLIDPVANWLVKRGVHPNTITVVGTLCTLVGGVIYATGHIRTGGWFLGLTALFDVLDVEAFRRPDRPSGSAATNMAAENPSMRVYKYVLAPGASTPMHTHERPYLIVAATDLQLKMTSPDGQSMSHEIKAGDFHWVDNKVTHSLANDGATEGQLIEIELK